MTNEYKRKIDQAILVLNIARQQNPNRYALSDLAQAIGFIKAAQDYINREVMTDDLARITAQDQINRETANNVTA